MDTNPSANWIVLIANVILWLITIFGFIITLRKDRENRIKEDVTRNLTIDGHTKELSNDRLYKIEKRLDFFENDIKTMANFVTLLERIDKKLGDIQTTSAVQAQQIDDIKKDIESIFKRINKDKE